MMVLTLQFYGRHAHSGTHTEVVLELSTFVSEIGALTTKLGALEEKSPRKFQ